MAFRQFMQKWLKSKADRDPAEAMSEESQRMSALLREQELNENAEQAGSPADQGSQTTQVQPAAKTSSSSAIPVPAERKTPTSIATPDALHQDPLVGQSEIPASPEFKPSPLAQQALPHLLAGSDAVSIVRGEVKPPSLSEISRPSVQEKDFLDSPEVQKLMADEGTQVEAYAQGSTATVSMIPPGIDKNQFHEMISRIDQVVKIPDVVIGSPAELPPYPELSGLVNTSDKAFAHLARLHGENSKLERFR